MARIDKIIEHLRFSINFSREYYKQLHKYLDTLNDFLAQFPQEHLWEETVLTTLFAKTYTHIFDTIPAFIPSNSNNERKMYYVFVDKIELDPAFSLLLYPYKTIISGIALCVENIPTQFLRFFKNYEIKHLANIHKLSFRTGLFLGFHYYGPLLPYHLQAATILCVRALKVLKVLKTVTNIYPLPSPDASWEEVDKYWKEIVTMINLVNKEDEEDDGDA